MSWASGLKLKGDLRIDEENEGLYFYSPPKHLLSSVFHDDRGHGAHDSDCQHGGGRVVPPVGGDSDGPCRAGKEALQLLSRSFLSSLPVFAQEAIGVCFAAGFDHLPVVWFLSLSSLGGFNYLN